MVEGVEMQFGGAKDLKLDAHRWSFRERLRTFLAQPRSPPPRRRVHPSDLTRRHDEQEEQASKEEATGCEGRCQRRRERVYRPVCVSISDIA